MVQTGAGTSAPSQEVTGEQPPHPSRAVLGELQYLTIPSASFVFQDSLYNHFNYFIAGFIRETT